MARRSTLANDEQRSTEVPQYDTVDDPDDIEEVRESEKESSRRFSESSRPHVTIKQDDVDEIGERQITVIEISSQRGSSKMKESKIDEALTIPVPECSSQDTVPPPNRQRTTNPEMSFDIGFKNVFPVLAHKMNMSDRDESRSVQYLNTTFFEVFAEPSEQYHSIACVWTLSFKIFEIVRLYSYKILTLIFGFVIALIGGFVFALFAFLNIWILRPLLILTKMALAQLVFIWPMFLIYIVRPLFYSVGAIFSTARLHTSQGEQITEVWEAHIHHV